MKRSTANLDATRRAILDALAHVIVESKGFGFSVQEVADRAGVTHRTVYNHFPTRDALSEGLADYVEELLSHLGPAPDTDVTLAQFPHVATTLYGVVGTRDVHVRAYAMLMVANRSPAALTRARLRRFEAVVARDATLPPGMSAREVSAAIRMFLSSLGWHTLTEHCGLSSEEAGRVATWAIQTMVTAVTPKKRARKVRKEISNDRKRRHD